MLLEKKLSLIRWKDFLNKGDSIQLTSILHVSFSYAAMRETLDRMRRNLLSEGRSEKRKPHLLKWDSVTKPRPIGGLGIGNLELKNWILLSKWWWR